jgi:hypothetical protein
MAAFDHIPMGEEGLKEIYHCGDSLTHDEGRHDGHISCM